MVGSPRPASKAAGSMLNPNEGVTKVKSTNKTSVQGLGKGTYRVGSTKMRSAISGRFVSKAASSKSPSPTTAANSKAKK